MLEFRSFPAITYYLVMQGFHIFQLGKRRPLHRIVFGKLFVFGVLKIGGIELLFLFSLSLFADEQK